MTNGGYKAHGSPPGMLRTIIPDWEMVLRNISAESAYPTDTQAYWNNYHMTHMDGIRRDDAIEAFNNLRLVHFSQFPSTKYINNPDIDKLRTRLTKVPYQIADKFF